MKASSTFRSLLLAFGLLLIHHTASWAQQYQFTSNGRDGNDTVTTTRIINSYAKVRAINGNVVYTNGPYVPQTRDRVLLIQMTGADSGVWQWDTVRIGGNPCYLSNIYKPFDTATGAKIQIIKAPQYQSLYIRSTGMLTAQPWNDSTGGILTFMVKDTFKIDSMGRCDVSYMGFKPKADPTPPGVNGLGGAGGAGGAIGQNGGDSALVIGSGVGGGGDGGMFGQYGTPGDTVVYALCPGCATAIYRDTARNLSLIDSGLGKNKFMMGGAGRTGHGGRGGRGGGGGGGGTAGPGTNGGAGGDGGRGGAGGRGGGIILFSSGYMQLPTGTVVFIAAGENGSDGMPGDTGQAGGNGGPGLGPCLSGGPGGGGRGAAGGNGGDGGGGGSGGTVYAVLFHHASTYTNASSSTPGGVRGNGGRGGPGGHGGQNGTTPGGGNCSGAIAGYGPDGDDGNDGNNGNNGTGSGGSGGGTGIAVIQPCQGSSGFYQNIEVGYGCSTQGYLPYFEGAAVGTPPFGYYSEDTFSSDYYTNYSILVIDASGCARYTAGEVSQPIYTPLYDITPSCPGMSNGSIQTTIDLSGGITAPPACVQPEAHSAIYDINGNFLDSTYAYFLSPGYYSVVWWINNDPMHYDTLEIEDVQPVTIMETLTQPTCDQPDGGSIELQQTSGGNICVWNTYHWSNQANGLYNDNLTAGTYDVTVGYDGPSICNFVSNVYYSTNYQCAQTFSYTLDPPVGSADVYLDVDVCAGTPYNYNGIDYYAGLNVIPPANPGGCDTTVYLTVNEYYSNQGYEHQQVCDGDQVYWNGAYYNQTGQYYATLYGADMHGCDSTAELDLLVLPPITAGNMADQTTGDGCSFQPDFAAMNIGGGDYNLTIGTSYSWSQCVGNVLQVENTVDVYDGSGCSAEFFVNVNYVDDQYMVSIDNVTPETCPGAGDGSVSYTVTNLDNQQCNSSGFELYYGTSSTVYNVNVSGPSYTSTDYNLPAGSYTYYIDGLGQCASPVNGSFTIGSGTGGSNGTEYDTICDGGTFVWSADGATYTQTGIYQYTITGGSATGCDSTANLHLVVLAPITAGNLADQMIGDGCANGPDYTAMNISGGDGSYSYVPYAGPASCFFSALVTPYQVDVTDGHGCTAEFDLYVEYQQDNYSVSIDNTTPENCLNASDGTVSYTVFNIDNAQCNNFYVYLDFNGPNGYSQSVSVLPYQVSYTDYSLPAGTYYYNVSGGGVCSSVVQGTFTIGTSTAGVAGSEYDTICDNSSILWNGTTYAQAGTYTYIVTGGSAGGCDSTATLYLAVAPTYASDWYDTIYAGQSVTLGGQQYSADGTYTATLTAGTGCDSTVTLYLTVLQAASPVTTYLTESICAGSSYNVGVHSYTSAGSYTDTLTAAAGQDSIIYLTLSVTQPVTGTATTSICSGSSYTWGGNSYSSAGTYSHTFTAVTGCDSIVTLTLSVMQPITGTATASICSGSSYTWGGNTYTQSGTYTSTFTAASGCDSMVTLTLSVIQPVTGAATASICSGSSYSWGGSSYLNAGTYSHTFTAVTGCDSIVTLTLSVIQPVTGAATASVCFGSSYSWGGSSYSNAGTYSHTFTAVTGCDSTVSLTLSVIQPITGTETANICAGNGYTWGGSTYTQAGTYSHTFTTSGGCDSIVTLTLTQSAAINANFTDTICQGESRTVGHNVYTASGTYTDILTAANGCDSTHILHLTVLQSVTPSLHITVSHGPVINGQQIDTFRANYTACDGAFYSWYLNLVPQGLHDSIAVIAHFVNQADSIVCRIDCQNRCASTTYTFSNRIMSGIGEPGSILRAVNVYPNPNTGAFTLEINSDIAATAQLSLLDVIGQTVLSDQMRLSQGDNKHTVVLPEAAASGIYIVQLSVQGQTYYERISIER